MDNGSPYVAMKPVVEGMGMSWVAQRLKLNLKDSKRYGCIGTPLSDSRRKAGDDLHSLRKLPGWLFSVNPFKVRPPHKAQKNRDWRKKFLTPSPAGGSKTSTGCNWRRHPGTHNRLEVTQGRNMKDRNAEWAEKQIAQGRKRLTAFLSPEASEAIDKLAATTGLKYIHIVDRLLVMATPEMLLMGSRAGDQSINRTSQTTDVEALALRQEKTEQRQDELELWQGQLAARQDDTEAKVQNLLRMLEVGDFGTSKAMEGGEGQDGQGKAGAPKESAADILRRTAPFRSK